MPTFTCSCCGATIPGPPLRWSFDTPTPWDALSDKQRENGHHSSDLCVIGSEHFFIRGLIEIPVKDGGGPFAWNVWVSVSNTNFLRACDVWEEPQRVTEPAYFGWLCNSIPGYPETLHLKTMVHTREVGVRPLVELEPTVHPLAVEQRNGITMDRVREIAEAMYHHNLNREGTE
jgi:hypothetical protein